MNSRRSPISLATLILGLLCCLVFQTAQAQRFPLDSPRPREGSTFTPDADGSEFHFARLIYGGNGFDRGYRGRGSWTTDWPEAEHFFIQGITRLTDIDTTKVSLYNGEGGEKISLTDGNVYDYPFLYAVEVGHWSLSAEEIAILRDYLLRGGFFIVDDFHGTQEWGVFVKTMQRVFPDRPIVDIPESQEVFHVLYDLDKSVQIPGLAALYNGVTYEQDGYNPEWKGIFDDQGRLMVVINHNMDMGDAWEHADTPGYPEHFTALAYRFAVNYAVYAMTH